MTQSTLPPAAEKAAYVNRMFAGIAHRYDLVNRLMTGGQDVGWRREVVELCRLPAGGRLLDVGTGTGDIAYEAQHRHQDAEVIGCDFTFEMMDVGRQKKAKRPLRRAGGDRTERVEFVQGDGLRLPFADGYFDAVTSGFLLRNVTDVELCLAEQRRVTKPGGRIVCLETSPPPPTLISPLLRFYMLRVIPMVGQLFSTGDGTSGKSMRPPGTAYRYLPQSTVAFLQPEEMVLQMERAGFRNVFYRTKMLGTVAIHVGAA